MANPDFSKIKNIYIPLFNYRIDHGPSSKSIQNKYFTGREKIINRLHLLFSNEKQRSMERSPNGAYLVTGYRGVGKTSVVREAFNHKEKKKRKSFKEVNELKVFNFALSQDEVHDIDLLRQIGLEIIRYSREEILKKSGLKIPPTLDRFFMFLLSFGFKFIAFWCSLHLVIYLFVPTAGFGFTNDLSAILKGLKEFLPGVFKEKDSIGKVFLFFGAFAIIFTFANLIASKLFNALTDLWNYKARLREIISLFEKRLYASVKQEDRGIAGINLGSTSPFTTIANKILSVVQNSNEESFNNTLSYTIASAKEIEQYLSKTLMILDELRSHRQTECLLRNIEHFVFIVDELDKIEPDYFFAPGDRESDAHIHHNDMPFHITTKARKRQEAIAKLLANLKSFLTDVKARFIFIGGRDMYDASLADISDRESFYSSIFNEVIYVETFFKDKVTSNAGLSQLAENYVLNFLFPDGAPENATLKSYIELIATNNRAEQFKILHLLQNFFIFLLYRSNGSPKKLIELIERYVVSFNYEKVTSNKWDNQLVRLKYSLSANVQLALRFSFRDQYEINLTSNLYRPYTIINSKHLKTLGDKLLYSSAFLMDHILKFHRTAFSWRNLEMIPDIILANKEPNFRQFFLELMEFLSRQHIRKTLNAIFQYKFHNKVKNELEYLSKTSEFSSAAFNFTLDESFHLKSYYKKKLAAKYLEYKQISSESLSFEYINSIGYLHSLIGDLHYYDEEYDDAIIHYTDAVQGFRNQIVSGKKLKNHQFVLYCRNQLSLGLCLEKMHSYDKAYSVYRNLILHSQSFVLSDQAKEDKENQSLQSHWERPYKRIQLFLRPHIALLGIIEKQRNDGITYDNLERNIHEYSKFLNCSDASLFPSNDNFLFEYEKMSSEGSDRLSSDKKRKVTLFVDYYLSVGNMLFFKNQIFYRLLFHKKKSDKETISNTIAKKVSNSNADDYYPSHAAYLYYLHALANFNTPFHENHDYFFPNKKVKTAQNRELSLQTELKFLNLFLHQNERYSILNSKQNETLANVLGKLGDALLACIYKTNQTKGTDFLQFFHKKGLNYVFAKLNSEFELLSLDTVAIIYRLSNEFYMKAGNSYEASFQFKKALYVIRDSVKHFSKPPTKSSIKQLAQVILNDQSEIAKGSNRAQIMKYRFFTEGQKAFTGKIYRGVSTEPDVKEVVALVETIKMKIDSSYISTIQIGAHNTVSSMFTRIMELKLKSKINLKEITKNPDDKENLKFLRPKNVLKVFFDLTSNETYSFGRVWEDLFDDKVDYIADGLFCNAQLIRILNTYGVSYILNYSFLASVHRSMAIFAVYYEILKKLGGSNYEDFQTKIMGLIGENTDIDFDPFYHYDLSSQYFRKAKEVHSEGKLYRKMFKELYTLDDDLNDNLSHFCAAIERFRINMKDNQSIANPIEDYLNRSKLRNYDNYVIE